MDVSKTIYTKCFETSWCLYCGRTTVQIDHDIDIPASNAAKKCTECQTIIMNPGLYHVDTISLNFDVILPPAI